MGLIEIFGGLGLTLFGIRFLRKGLDRLFGGNLVRWMSRMTASPLKAFFGGICAGTIAPSSTGLSLFTTQMLEQGRINARRMLVVLLGANVGMTVTVQLLAFRVVDYVGLLLIFGVITFQFLKRETFRGVGQCVLSLGFVFLAIGMISDGAAAMTASPEWVEIFRILQGHPWLIFLAVAALAIVLQSSTASIGLGIGLASSGLLTAQGLLPWVVGTNVGLGVTSLLAGWNRLEGRRMGVANLLLKIGVALPFLLLPGLAQALFDAVPGSLLRQTAVFHTGFNLLVGLVALPLLGVVERFCAFLLPGEERSQEARSFLDESVLDTPSFALARATRETLRMSDHVRMMLESFWAGRESPEVARRIQKEDDVVDRINLQLKDYLCRIVDTHKSDDLHWQLTLLTFSNELESIGDLVDKHLCDLVIKQRNEGVVLTQEDQADLADAYHAVLTQFEIAGGLLTTRSAEDAEALLAGKEPFNDWCRQIQRNHYNRLHTMSKNASAIFLDYLNAFRRISSHLSTIGYTFRRGTPFPPVREVEPVVFHPREAPSR